MTLKTVEKTQSILLSDIEACYSKNDLKNLVSLIDTYSNMTQLINNELYNDVIETILDNTSQKIGFVSKNEMKDESIIVFYDQIGSTVCLSEQYIDGIIELGYKLIYIYENPYFTISEILKSKLVQNNVESYFFNCSSKYNQQELILEIYSIIDNSKCSKLIVQSPAYGALCSIVLFGLNNVMRYRVVPGDHHFYIGVKCTDYFFEFRPYGITRAIRERNISPSRIIKLPYYPIINIKCDFKGFPVETAGKSVVVTAGDTYKFFGSDIFYEICEKIALENNVLIIFIGKYNKKLANLIKQKKLDKKIIQIGYRSDFSQCLLHCDMLLSSYPMIGGLISQMASAMGKPIIAYADKKEIDNGRSFEDILGNNHGERRMSKSSLEQVCSYASNLINNKEFRIRESTYIKSLVQTKDKFNKGLHTALSNPKTNITNDDLIELVDKKSFIRTYLAIQNGLYPTFLQPLFRKFGIAVMWKFKHHIMDCLRNPIMISKYLYLHFR